MRRTPIFASLAFAPLALGAPAPSDPIAKRLDVTSCSVQTLHVQKGPGGYTVRLQLDGAGYDLELAPCSLRADSFRVLVDDGSGRLHRVDAPPLTTFRGDLVQVAGSAARASITATGLNAVITLPDGAAWGVQPLDDGSGRHAIYRTADIQAPITRSLIDQGAGASPTPAPPAPRGATNRIIEVAFDADHEYFVINNSSVQNVVNDIESLMNGVESIYELNTGVTFEVTTIIVRAAEPDPYSSSNPITLMNQFRTQWQGSYSSPENAIQRDVAHLCTGKVLDAGVVAVSTPSSICTSNAYSYTRTRYTSNIVLRRALVAHQFGHNLGAENCDNQPECNIMCSCIGCGAAFGCSGDVTHFGPGEAANIAALADAAPCLTPGPAGPLQVLSDSFDSLAIDPNRWSYVDAAIVSPDAVAPPTPPFALGLSAVNANEFSDAEIRSNEVNVVDAVSPVLRYAVEARGVPAGGALIVEVWSSELRWVEVNRIVSDGVDDAAFTPFSHALSGALIHSEARVRLRAAVDAPTQNWFVDDVYLGPGPAPCACDWNDDDDLTSQDFFDFLADFFKDHADFNHDGVTTSQDFFDFLACFFEGC